MSEIPEIHVPDISPPFVYSPYVPTPIETPVIIPGCQYFHRDQNLNPNLLIDDPNGVGVTCPEGGIPHFYPMDYTPDNITVIKEAPPPKQKEPEVPETKKPEVPDLPLEDVDEEIVICPGPTDLRVGDFRNDKKLERVSGHRLSLDGTRCITEYESTTFAQQYIPSPPQIVSTAAIALVAAGAPLLLNVIKPLVKNIVKKLTTKKEKKDGSSD
jgi:hypothetical protein